MADNLSKVALAIYNLILFSIQFLIVGAKIVMLCRDVSKAELAANEIQEESGVGGKAVVVEPLDLASLDSVRKCATKILAQEERIDILINNAGRYNKSSFKI